MYRAPQASNTRLLWILVGAGVLVTAAVVVAFVYFVGGFVALIRSEISRDTIANEYNQYFYEVYELPSEPMFSPASTPIERLGNRTREMLRFLLTAQACAADVETQHSEAGVYHYATYSSQSNFRKALDLLDSLAKEYAKVAEAHAEVSRTFLPEIRQIATDAQSKRFFKEQERFHHAEAEVYVQERKVVERLVQLEKERANLLWENRRYIKADDHGYAALSSSAPRNAKVRLSELERRINEQEAVRDELHRKLQGAFNKFYYTVTGQREDFTD